MEQFPIELHHIICTYLDFDNLHSYQNVFSIKLNHETLFSIKYYELYSSMKKVIKVDNLEINWKFINEQFEMIDYYGLLKVHKFNVETIDDSYDLHHNCYLSTNFLIKDLICSSLIIKDWSNCYKFKKILIDKGFNSNISKDIYDMLTQYQLKQIDKFVDHRSTFNTINTTIQNLFKNGYLDQKINYLDIKPRTPDDLMDSIRSITILIIILFDDPKFDKNRIEELIRDFEHMMAISYATHGSRYDDTTDQKILEILIEEIKKI